MAAFLEPHGDVGLGVGSAGDRVHLVELQGGLVRGQLADGVEHRVDRPVARARRTARLPVDGQGQLGPLALGAGGDHQARDGDPLVAAGQAVVDQGDDVLVEHLLLLVGQVLEALEGLVHRLVAQLVAQGLELFAEGVAARVLAHHQVGLHLADVLGLHDLVGLGVLQHAILVDAALVGEGVLADDGLVELHRKAGDRRDIAAGAGDVPGVDAGLVGQPVGAHAQRHHHFFQGRIAGPLADAVDRHLDLPRPALHARERIGDRQAQVVVAVGGEDHCVRARHIGDQVAEHVGVFLRVGVADRVGDVDGGGAGLDRHLDAAAQEVPLGAGGVLGRPFHVVGVVARQGDRGVDRLQDRIRPHLQLVLHVHGAGGDEGVDAAAAGRLDGFGAALDVLLGGPGQAADGRLGDDLGDAAHRLEVAV